MVYLDYNATTPLAREAAEAMVPLLRGPAGNPSSIHAAGRMARAAVDEAREELASILHVRPHELIFTSGGTESCNLAVIGLARAHSVRGRHIICSAVEHHAVIHALDYLRHFEGYDVTILPVDRRGVLDVERFSAAIRPDTILATVMHANNETGVIQPIAELAQICSSHGVHFHSDCVQSFGKIPVDPIESGAAALSIAAHKFYGPQGVGALWLSAGVAISRTAHGGSHENSRRPGTENVPGIVGMAVAARIASLRQSEDAARLESLREQLWEGISAACPEAVRNGVGTPTLANTLNVSFPGLDGEALLIGLDLEGVCVSSGSACMVGSVQPSHVLVAMGISPEIARSSVRFSLGHDTADADIAHCIRAVSNVVQRQLASTP